jgi:hypothetical protein
MNADYDSLLTRRDAAAGNERAKEAAQLSAVPSIRPATGLSTPDYLARRLDRVINDLGLMPHIPMGWLQPNPEGLSFRSLNVHEADKLVLAVEDVAYSRTANRGPDLGQLRLF